MEEFNFEKIVSSTVPLTGRSFDVRACPDQYLGQLSEIMGKPQFPFRLNASQRTEHPCVVMVLESPHKDEFIGDPGPAKGFTGDMIRNFLHEALSQQNVGGFGLVLVNAIQHQCSLGISTSEHRDKIFRAVWTQGGHENFVTRLRSVLRSSDIVMNCCTKGNDFELNTPLRSLVEASMRLHFPAVQTIRRMHPASWRTKSWRGLTWRDSTEAKNDDDAKALNQTPVIAPATKDTDPEAERNLMRKLSADAHAGFNTESACAEQEDNVAVLSDPNDLVSVKEHQMIRGSSCTVLVMGDGSKRHMKTSTFDLDGKITEKAKKLIGTKVRTSCWDPKNAPGKWSRQGYFRNIYTN
jgi:hypothetical protein